MSPRDLPLHLDASRGVRQALGVQLRAERTLRRQCVRSIETHAAAGPIRAYRAVDWACAASTQRGASEAAQRVRMARGLPTSLRAILPETAVPTSGLVRAFRRPTPALVTAPQITALIRAAQDLGPRSSRRPHTFATCIGVLASPGRRVGEAIRLTVPAVHLEATPPVVPLRETTCHQSRLVPLQPTPVGPLRRYRAVRTTLHEAALSDVCLVSEQGQARTHDTLGRWCAPLGRPLGREPTAGGRRPSLQAVRHACARARRRRWQQDGMDGPALRPHLAVYLGHVRPQERACYLTATPARLRAAARRFQRYAARGEAA